VWGVWFFVGQIPCPDGKGRGTYGTSGRRASTQIKADYRPEPGSSGPPGRGAMLLRGTGGVTPDAQERPANDRLVRCLASKIILELRAEPLAAGAPTTAAEEAEAGLEPALAAGTGTGGAAEGAALSTFCGAAGASRLTVFSKTG